MDQRLPISKWVGGQAEDGLSMSLDNKTQNIPTKILWFFFPVPRSGPKSPSRVYSKVAWRVKVWVGRGPMEGSYCFFSSVGYCGVVGASFFVSVSPRGRVTEMVTAIRRGRAPKKHAIPHINTHSVVLANEPSRAARGEQHTEKARTGL